MPRPTWIFGHRNPDADSICSALAYAEFKRQTDEGAYEAARCGNSNVRIDAILARFGARLPTFIGDVTPRLRDTMTTNLVTVGPNATSSEVLELIDRHDIQVVPVVGDGGRLEGTVSIYQLGQAFLPKAGPARDVRRVDTTLRDIARVLRAEVLHLERGDEVTPLYIRVAAMDLRSFDRLQDEEGIPAERTIIIVGDREEIQRRAIERGVRLLVVSGSRKVAPDVLESAREAGVSVLSCPYDSASTAWAIRSATRVSSLLARDFAEFSPEETLDQVRRQTASLAPAVFMVTDEGRLVGIFSRRDLLRRPSTRIILVDHNELTQAVPGAEHVEIVEVVDHHRLGDLRTQEPILFLNRPVGSTCTIVADLFRTHGLPVTPELAGVMMGGLVSDTLNLRSPTTTPVDERILRWLESIAGVTGEELAETIFSAGSVVAIHTPGDVVGLDRKVYEEGSWRFSVSQVEELGFTEFWAREEALADALEESRAREGLDFAALFVTDVKSQDSLLLVRGDPGVRGAIPYPSVEDGEVFELHGVVSRKKQLLPFLTGILKNLQAVG
jgi:manganese-dependent inorganic pyrophosphatase